MTAASEHVAPDSERAETYLRLMAEAELRRALAMPEYKPPHERLPARVAGMIVQSSRMRRRRTAIDRLMRQQASGKTSESRAQAIPLLPLIRRAVKSLESARTVVAGQTAPLRQAATRTRHQLSAHVLGAAWPVREQLQRRFGHGGYEPPPAASCLTRLETVAGMLAAVGAITDETEENVVGGLRSALAARSRIEPEDLLSHHLFGGHSMRRRARATAAPSGPPRAIPVGAFADGQVNGHPVRFSLGVLLLDHGSATLTVRARFGAALTDQHDRYRQHPMIDALNEVTASDDRGGSYDGYFNGGGGDEEWDCRFEFSPVPSATARWLDVVLPGAPAVRVHLDAAPKELQVTTEPVTDSAADRFLDSQTLELLSSGRGRAARTDDDHDEPSLLWLASHLLAAGVLTVDSPSLRRLAAVAERMGEHLPGGLKLIQPDALPAEWLRMQAAAHRRGGPVGRIPVVAVLPEVDGARCVIMELISETDGASLNVHCTGWPEPRRPRMLRIEQFRWSARDDLGGCYVLEEGSMSYGDGRADLEMRVRPAINPQARVLDVILTGPTTRVTASVPLDWQEAL